MATKKTKFDSMTRAELMRAAEDAGMPDVAHLRRPELRRAMRANEAGDSETLEAILQHARERAEQQKANAERVVDKARTSAEKHARDGAEVPARNVVQGPDEAKAVVRAAVADTRGRSEQQRMEAMEKSLVAEGVEGDELVRRMLERAERLSARRWNDEDFKQKESPAERAIRLAGGVPGPPGPPPGPRYEVLTDCYYYAAHGTYRLHKGAIVSPSTHDMKSLWAQDVPLRRIERVETEVGEMGQVRQRVTPAEEEAAPPAEQQEG